jgi:glycosyltransferase involved in cell wall biosynthesis
MRLFSELTFQVAIRISVSSLRSPAVDGFVSVVVPTRNRAEKLRVCLESLLKQDFPADKYEIVVVDDGSTDASREVALSLASGGSGPELKVAAQEHRGGNRARNVGLAVSRGDPVCIVDDDVQAPATWLAAMADGFDRYPHADAFAGRVQVRVEDPRWKGCRRHPVAASLELGSKDTEVPGAVGANMALRRRAVDRVGGFDEWLARGQETEWFERLRSAGGTTMYVARASVWHRRTADDIRLNRLVRSSFGQGAATYTFFLRIGRTDIPRHAIRAALRYLQDAMRELCPGALGHAAVQLGYAYGMWRHRGLATPEPRTGPPPNQEWTLVTPTATGCNS